MHIAFAASECVPFSKTGGLADVVGALPRALAALGHQVSVYVPRYRQTKLADPQTVVRSITIPFDDKYRFCSVVTAGTSAGVRFYFVDYPPYFDRDALYGSPAGDYPDNAERFALFSRAVLEASKILGVPQVFHCHDWQSALVPVMLRTLYDEDPAFRDVATTFTIHNMGYQGLFPPDSLPLLMLPWTLRDRRMRFWLFACPVFLLGLALERYTQPHYLAPFLGVLFVLLLQGMRHLWVSRWGRYVVGVVVLACVGGFVQQVVSPRMPYPYPGNLQRARILRQLEGTAGQHLVLVHYGAEHDVLQEWVYNRADIDGAKVVWAREMSPAEDRELKSYFRDRKIWVVDADAAEPRLTAAR